MPETSIVIRTFNEERHIGNLLDGIAKQQYKNYEVIIVDSGSTDKTLAIAQTYPVKIVKIESRDFTFGYSLNIGCRESKGEYLVFVSAHVIPVNELWLSEMIASFRRDERIAMVYGRQMGNDSSKFSEKIDFKRMFGDTMSSSNVSISYANNANAAIRKVLWECRQFDEYLFGLEDIDWARAMKSEGRIVHYAPKAVIYHIHEERWYQVFNRYRREAIAAVRIGLERPPQSRLHVFWLCLYILVDFFYSFPNYTYVRITEIVKFRYFQWKGSRVGWKQGREIDLDIEKNNLFYPTETHSVVVTGVGRAGLFTLPSSGMHPGDILVRVDYVGVSPYDLMMYEGVGFFQNNTASYSCVPGYEFSGRVAKIGANNRLQERFKIGDAVVGRRTLWRETGASMMHGAYGKYILVPGDQVYHTPSKVNQKQAVLIELLACILKALKCIESHITQKSKILIIGAGEKGYLTAQVLTSRGYTVDVFDAHTECLEVVKVYTRAVMTSLDCIKDYDVIIETSGVAAMCERVVHESRRKSTFLLLGSLYGEIRCDFNNLHEMEKHIVGSYEASEEDFLQACKYISDYDVSPLIETVLPLEDFKKAWKLYKTREHMKVLLQP